MNYARDCIEFMNESLTCFHAAKEIARRLEEAGYVFLKEQESWNVVKGGKYSKTNVRKKSAGGSVTVNVVREKKKKKESKYNMVFTSAPKGQPTKLLQSIRCSVS